MSAVQKAAARRVCLTCNVSIRHRRPQAVTCTQAKCRQKLSRANRSAKTWSEERAAAWGLEARDFWRTPDDVFAECERRWGPYDLDAAATPEDTKCPAYLTPRNDALHCRWVRHIPGGLSRDAQGLPQGRVWLNPPYSKRGGYNHNGLASWAAAVIRNSTDKLWITMLVPHTRTTEWSKSLARAGAEFHAWPKRIAFIHPDSGEAVRGNRFDSMIVHLAGYGGQSA